MTLSTDLLTAALQAGSNEAGTRSIVFVLHVIGVLFALSLTAVSLIAWSRRRNMSLVFVSAAFFVFAVMILLDEILTDAQTTELVGGVLELVVLFLFFLTVFGGLGRTNRSPEEETSSRSS